MNDAYSESFSKQRLYRSGPAARAAVACAALLAAAIGARAQAPAGPPADVAAAPPDAERTASGLASKVLAEGFADRPPDANDMVRVHYTGWTPQGVQFQSSHDEGEPAIFNLQDVFPGWQEAMQLMVRGEKRRFWIPERLGPKNATRGAKGDAVFDVEMIDILRMPNVPDLPDESAEGVERTPSGALTERVEAGQGSEYPGWDSAVLLKYTGWTTDNVIFDATAYRGRPTAVPLDRVMPAFAEAVQMMVVGEKRRVWIPAELAQGNWTNQPQGMLVFEIRLVRILPDGALSTEKPETEPGAASEPGPGAAGEGGGPEGSG